MLNSIIHYTDTKLNGWGTHLYNSIPKNLDDLKKISIIAIKCLLIAASAYFQPYLFNISCLIGLVWDEPIKRELGALFRGIKEKPYEVAIGGVVGLILKLPIILLYPVVAGAYAGAQISSYIKKQEPEPI